MNNIINIFLRYFIKCCVLSILLKSFLTFLDFSNMGYTQNLIKCRKNILVTFIHNLTTFFEYFQKLLTTFLLSDRPKMVLKVTYVIVH